MSAWLDGVVAASMRRDPTRKCPRCGEALGVRNTSGVCSMHAKQYRCRTCRKVCATVADGYCKTCRTPPAAKAKKGRKR